MTEQELNEIRKRCKKATEGPWWDESGVIHCDCADPRGPHIAVMQSGNETRDASFITHAREDIPDLLAEIDRLRAELSELPHTADGVLVKPGMKVYSRDDCTPYVGSFDVLGMVPYSDDSLPTASHSLWPLYYSTPEMARAAKEGA